MSALHKTPEEWEQDEARKDLERASKAVTDHGGRDQAGTGYNRDLDRAEERARNAGIR